MMIVFIIMRRSVETAVQEVVNRLPRAWKIIRETNSCKLLKVANAIHSQVNLSEIGPSYHSKLLEILLYSEICLNASLYTELPLWLSVIFV